MYGFKTSDEAERRARELSARYPENRFEVAPHSYSERSYGERATATVAETWGVKCYVPYCDAMPYRLAGFVWFA